MSKILVLDRGDGLADHIRGLADRFADAPKVSACTRIAAVGDMLEEEGPFDVLVAGPSLGTRSGLARLQVIAEELPEMQIVLAFSRRPDASLREVIRTGAIDLLQLPVEDTEFVEALDRALGMVPKVTAPAAPSATASTSLEPAADIRKPGSVFTIASATGGCGKTFYTTNLAWFLHHHTDKRVCIVDLDLQFGEVSTALRLRPKFTIMDALGRDSDPSELAQHIEEYTVVHESGVHVLAAPRDPSDADRITPPDVTRILEAVRQRFDYVVVDTPPQLAETVLAAFDVSEKLYVMATLDLPSVRNMSVFLSTLERLQIDSDDIRLVLNKAESDVGIEVSQVTKLFPQGFESVLPYAREVSRSINLGKPVMEASPEAEVSRLMTQGMANLLPEAQRLALTEAPAPSKSVLRRMFRK